MKPIHYALCHSAIWNKKCTINKLIYAIGSFVICMNDARETRSSLNMTVINIMCTTGSSSLPFNMTPATSLTQFPTKSNSDVGFVLQTWHRTICKQGLPQLLHSMPSIMWCCIFNHWCKPVPYGNVVWIVTTRGRHSHATDHHDAWAADRPAQCTPCLSKRSVFTMWTKHTQTHKSLFQWVLM